MQQKNWTASVNRAGSGNRKGHFKRWRCWV